MGFFSGKNARVGQHFLFYGTFPTQGSNLHLLWLLCCRRILYLLSHWGSSLQYNNLLQSYWHMVWDKLFVDVYNKRIRISIPASSVIQEVEGITKTAKILMSKNCKFHLKTESTSQNSFTTVILKVWSGDPGDFVQNPFRCHQSQNYFHIRFYLPFFSLILLQMYSKFFQRIHGQWYHKRLNEEADRRIKLSSTESAIRFAKMWTSLISLVYFRRHSYFS